MVTESSWEFALSHLKRFGEEHIFPKINTASVTKFWLNLSKTVRLMLKSCCNPVL